MLGKSESIFRALTSRIVISMIDEFCTAIYDSCSAKLTVIFVNIPLNSIIYKW